MKRQKFKINFFLMQYIKIRVFFCLSHDNLYNIRKILGVLTLFVVFDNDQTYVFRQNLKNICLNKNILFLIQKKFRFVEIFMNIPSFSKFRRNYFEKKSGWWFLSHNFISLRHKEKIPFTHGIYHINFKKVLKKELSHKSRKIN